MTEITPARALALEPLHDGLQGRITVPADGGTAVVGWYEHESAAAPDDRAWSAYLWRPDLRDSRFRAASSEAVRAAAQAVLDSAGPWWQ